MQFHRHPVGAGGMRVHFLTGQGEPELGALAFLTLESNLAAHQFHESLAHREAETGPAEPVGGRRVRPDGHLKALALATGRVVHNFRQFPLEIFEQIDMRQAEEISFLIDRLSRSVTR